MKKFILLFLILSQHVLANYLNKANEFAYCDDFNMLKTAREKNHPLLNKALMIRDTIARNNYNDIKFLFDFIVKNIEYSETYSQEVLKKIDQDLLAIKRFIKNNKNNKNYPFILRNFLTLTLQQNHFKKIKELIINQKEQLFKGHLSYVPAHRDIKILKLALWYIIAAQENQLNKSLLKSLKVAYPIKLKKSQVTENLLNFALFVEQDLSIFLPNSGYILNGDLTTSSFRGTDCSGFVSFVLGETHHFGTKEYAKIWNYLAYKDKVLSRKSLLFSKKFKPLYKKQELKTGDLVIWRWFNYTKNFMQGHIVFFVDWYDKEKKTFMALEAALKPLQNKPEGLGIRILEIERPNAARYCLRPNI